MAPAHLGRCRMGGCETTPTTTHARGTSPTAPPFDPATSRLFPRSRSSAAARQRQARSSSPAPWTGALTLRALQLDSRPRGGTTTGTYEESQRNSPTPGPTTTAGHWARSPCPLDREFPHGWWICVGRAIRAESTPSRTKSASGCPTRGLGTELLTRLSSRARAEGIHRFTALVAQDNMAMAGLLRHMSASLAGRSPGTVDYEVTLMPPGKSTTTPAAGLRQDRVPTPC
jgi:hypothetical protein